MAIGVLLAVTAMPAQAALSSTSDPVPGFNGTVLAVAYAGDTVYVGGTFTAAVVKGRTVARNRLAAIDASTGELLPWAPAADNRVTAIAVEGSSVYVAGDFSAVGGVRRDSLARLNATSGAVSGSFKHSISGRPYALAAAGGRLYLGGSITAVNGQKRSRLAAFDLATGALQSWGPAVDDHVQAITASGGRIYVGGRFHQVNRTGGYDRLVALDPYSGAIVTAFKPRAQVVAFAVAVTADAVYSATGGQGGKVNAYSLSGTPRWTATFDGDAQAVAVLGGTVYAGGHFDRACRTARTGDQGSCLDGSHDRVKLAALSVTDGRLQSWTADANGIDGVLTLTAASGRVAAGGAFTVIGGRSQKRFAQFS